MSSAMGCGLVWARWSRNEARSNDTVSYTHLIAGPQNSQQSYSGDYFTGIYPGASEAAGAVTYVSRVDGNVQGFDALGNPIGSPTYGALDPKRGHTQYFRDLYLWPENGSIVFPSLGINVNPATTVVPRSLQVDCQSTPGTGAVRFSCLPSITATRLIGCDNNGDLTYVPLGGTGGISNACTTDNFVTKTDGTAGDLQCSLIYDNDVQVGIATTTPTERLHVAGNITAAGFINAENQFAGFALSPLKTRVLAHGGSLGLGYNAGLNGDFNTSVGDDAGNALATTAVANTLLGRRAGNAVSTQQRNCLLYTSRCV